jgi:hypothetical protein
MKKSICFIDLRMLLLFTLTIFSVKPDAQKSTIAIKYPDATMIDCGRIQNQMQDWVLKLL